jgi:hypothetical protein
MAKALEERALLKEIAQGAHRGFVAASKLKNGYGMS